jgi:hypothetical protein
MAWPNWSPNFSPIFLKTCVEGHSALQYSGENTMAWPNWSPNFSPIFLKTCVDGHSALQYSGENTMARPNWSPNFSPIFLKTCVEGHSALQYSGENTMVRCRPSNETAVAAAWWPNQRQKLRTGSYRESCVLPSRYQYKRQTVIISSLVHCFQARLEIVLQPLIGIVTGANTCSESRVFPFIRTCMGAADLVLSQCFSTRGTWGLRK